MDHVTITTTQPHTNRKHITILTQHSQVKLSQWKALYFTPDTAEYNTTQPTDQQNYTRQADIFQNAGSKLTYNKDTQITQ